MTTCTTCNGTKNCPRCGGTKKYLDLAKLFEKGCPCRNGRCWRCGGKGQVKAAGPECAACKGTRRCATCRGTVRQTSRLGVVRWCEKCKETGRCPVCR